MDEHDMSEKQPLQDPINRVVSVFDEHQLAESAKQELLKHGYDGEQIRLFHGPEDASDVDTSAKWFADTDVDIARYRKELADGNTVLSVPVVDGTSREEVHGVLKQCNARLTTHFGDWITEILK